MPGGIELARAFIAIRAEMGTAISDIEKGKPQIAASLAGLGSMVRGMIMAAAGGTAVIGSMMKAGQFEQTMIAFETMIGSTKETKKTLADLTEFAAKTPFEMPEILQAARGLIQFGERGDQLMKTLNSLGNAAAGTSTPFGMLALVFNQVRGVGKLLTQDFRQLSTRGILSLQDLANYYKVTTQEAQDMLSSGKITFEDFSKVLASLSGPGGRFFNLMEKQSKSFLGLWSTLKDAISIVSREFGEKLLPLAKSFLETTIQLAESTREWLSTNKETIDVIVKVVAALVAIKVATMAWAIASKVAASAQAMLLALQGPKGWAQLAAGVAIGTAAYLSLSYMMSEAESKANRTAKAIEKTGEEGQKAARALTVVSQSIEDIDKGLTKLVGGLDRHQASDLKRIVTWMDSIDEMIIKRGDAINDYRRRALAPEMTDKYLTLMTFSDTPYVVGHQMDTTSAVSNAAKALEDFNQQLKDMETPEEKFENMTYALQRLVSMGLMTAASAAKIMASESNKQLATLREEVDVMESIAKLRRERKYMGLSDDQLAQWMRFNETPGVLKESIREFGELKRKTAAMELEKDLTSPMEKAEDEFLKLVSLADLMSPERALRGFKRLKASIQPEFAFSGRLGFADMGKQIQDALLKKNDPQFDILAENKLQTKLLDSMDKKIKDIENPMRLVGPE